MINLASISNLLRPGLEHITGYMDSYVEQYKEIFKTRASEKYQEYIVEMRLLGPAGIKGEGQPGMSDTMGQRFLYTFTHKNLYNSFSITKEAIEDNLYKDSFPDQARSLKQSIAVAEDILGANIINNAFNPAYPMGDGKPVCSTSHPVDGGTYANAFDAGTAYVDFSEAGMEQAIIVIQKMLMQSGILAAVMPEKVLIGRDLQFAAVRLLESSYRTDTANNDISAIYNKSYIPKGYTVNQYIAAPNYWFILTNSEGLVHFKRSDLTTDTYADFGTQTILASASKRLSFGCFNPRSIFGSPGA